MGVVVALVLIALGAEGRDGSRPAVAPPRPAPPEQAKDPAKPASHLIDMVVAQVDAAVITLSELVAETRLVLLKTAGAEVARASYLSQGLLNAVLKNIVSRELLLSEVRRLKLRDVPDQEMQQALEGIQKRFTDPADYERFLVKSGFREPGTEMIRGFDAPASLLAIVTAERQVERFLEVRVRKGTPRESDVEACYEANRVQVGPRTLDELRGEIQARLAEQERERAIAMLLEQLAKRVTIRYAAGFEPNEPIGTIAVSIGLECPPPKSGASRRE